MVGDTQTGTLGTGSPSGNDALPGGRTYTCTITATSPGGTSVASTSFTFLSGCGCGDSSKSTTNLLPVPASPAATPIGCWYVNDNRAAGVSAIVSLATEATTYPTITTTAPAGLTTAMKLVTGAADGDKAQVALAYGSAGALVGKTLKTLVADSGFTVKYDWFKGTCPSPACNQFAAPNVKLVLYSASVTTGSATIPGKYSTLVWEPYWNTPYYQNGSGYVNTWNSDTIDSARGTDTLVTTVTASSKGWWTTSSSWGASAYKVNGGGFQRNLKQWCESLHADL